MAIFTTRHESQLEQSFVLAPERYDPRREALGNGSAAVPLRELAISVRQTVNATTSGLKQCIILDTSDAREGVITSRKEPVGPAEIGSTKKVASPNDVMISRLRPYLRQVALVDEGVQHLGPGVVLGCSSEFFILRSSDGKSIAFLVPFLLSDPVQRVLAASQEGGHHPRFNESALLELPVPTALLKKRDEISAMVEKAVKTYRTFEAQLGLAMNLGSLGLDD